MSSPAVFPAQIFAAICARDPQRLAIRGDGLQLTYGELDRRTARRAAWLASQGVGRLDRVGIRVVDACDFIEWIVACVRLGAVYVPIDPKMSEAAVVQAIAAAGVGHIILDAGQDFGTAVDVPLLAPPPASFDAAAVDWAPGAQGAGEPVCIMFTSGSTGVPKGVICPLGGIVPLVTGNSHLPILPDDVVLQISAREFDAFTWEVWGALLNGASLFLLPARWSVSDLGRHIAQGGVTAAFFTARLFDLLVESAPGMLAGMRLISFGGEAASPHHCALARRLFPKTQLINGYGPTENTTFTCSYVLGEGADDETQVPIGNPKMGDTVLLLDPETLEPIEGEGEGELFVGGPGIAIGYTDAALTAERFITHPTLGLRLFRTADLVRRLADGDYLYLGRRDRQVKILGQRVNLFEVEQAIGLHPDILGAHVVFDAFCGRQELIAFCRTRGDEPVPRRSLVDFLGGKLDAYAVPQWFEHVRTPPLKQNGKVDVAALVAGLKHRVTERESDDPLEQLWRRILYPTPVSEETHFFDEGGDSFAALNIVLEAEKLFGVSLPTDYLASHPTLGEFRANLFSTAAPPLLNPPVRHDGEPTLVLVPWLNGAPGIFSNVLEALQVEGRVVTIDMTRFEADSSIRDIRDISRQCADALVAQGVSRVSITGPSLGGVIALDLGAELAARGVEVETIVMLDSYAPWSISADKVWTLIKRPIDLVFGRADALDRAETEGRISHGKIMKMPTGALSARLLGGFGQFRTLRPRIPPARSIALVKAAQRPPESRVMRFPFLGWKRRLPHLPTVVTEGSHMSMLDATNGPQLAAHIAALVAGGRAGSANSAE